MVVLFWRSSSSTGVSGRTSPLEQLGLGFLLGDARVQTGDVGVQLGAEDLERAGLFLELEEERQQLLAVLGAGGRADLGKGGGDGFFSELRVVELGEDFAVDFFLFGDQVALVEDFALDVLEPVVLALPLLEELLELADVADFALHVLVLAVELAALLGLVLLDSGQLELGQVLVDVGAAGLQNGFADLVVALLQLLVEVPCVSRGLTGGSSG